MTTWRNAPLVEVIFELRWGGGLEELLSKAQKREAILLPSALAAVLHKSGFNVLETANEVEADIPHVVRYRYRKAKDAWPCVQLGSGILTVNQVNAGYDWAPFKATCLEALSAIDEAREQTASQISPTMLILRYQDALAIESGEDAVAALRRATNITLSLPGAFLSEIRQDAKTSRIAAHLEVQLDRPKGAFGVHLQPGTANGEPVLIVEFRLVSKFDASEGIDTVHIADWLEQAHSAHKSSFAAVIRDNVKESMK